MSQRQVLKRRISFSDEPDGKKADRKTSPPGNVFQAASGDTNLDASRIQDMELNLKNASFTRRGSRKSYVEYSSESENDDQSSRGGNLDDPDYHPRAGMRGKSKPSRSNGDNQLVKPALTRGKAPSKNEEALVAALEKLKCTEDDLKLAFDSLRIRQCADRKKTPNGESHYTASTMPTRILEEFGWDFNDQSRPRPTPDNMRLLYSTEPGKRVDMRQAPKNRLFVHRDNGKTPAVAPREFQGRIIENINRMKISMESEHANLAVPADWGDEEHIGSIPCLPERFLRFKRDKTPPKESKGPLAAQIIPGSVGSTWESVGGSAVKPSLPIIIESSEDVGASERASLGSESGLRQQDIGSTAINRSESAINNVQGSSLEHKDGLDEADVSSGVALSFTTLLPGSTKCSKESAENKGNDIDDPQFRTQGFDDEGVLRIPTLEEALKLWNQWKSQSREREIGDFAAEHLGMNDPQPTPAQVSQLEVWLQRLITIHESKDIIARLQREFGTREGRMKGITYRYPEVIFEERSKITDIGLDGTAGLNGNILLNEYTDDISDSAPALLFRWASFIGLDIQKQVGEIHVETRFGDLIPGLFAGQDWKEYRCRAMPFVSPLQPFGTIPEPDFAARASGPGWEDIPMCLRPVLFVADAKIDDKKDVGAQLAMSSMGTLFLFILFYLDTRVKLDARLPAFCWIPAVVYHRGGFDVYAHFPKLKIDEDGNWHWGFGSQLMCGFFNDAWHKTQTQKRMKALNALIKLRTHALLVSERLCAWMKKDNAKFNGKMAAGEEASQILDQLIARARFESGEYRWIIEKAEKVGDTDYEEANVEGEPVV